MITQQQIKNKIKFYSDKLNDLNIDLEEANECGDLEERIYLAQEINEIQDLIRKYSKLLS